MIPIEKLIPIEQKARNGGYNTEIADGGRYVKFSKYEYGGSIAVTCMGDEVKMWTPANNKVTIETYKAFLDEQMKLLELAMMLQENIIDGKTEDEV